MAKGSNQKLKLSRLIEILKTKTDQDHGLTMGQIIENLALYGIHAERKSIYSDIEDIRSLGYEIKDERKGKDTYYSLQTREFELGEVKMIIDAIQASKFITDNRSKDLIKKMKGLVSEHQAKQLQRQVFMETRVKSSNEAGYNNVDKIHSAINSNRKIRFRYYRWSVDKKLEATHNGEWICVSPWALAWRDENYYLIAYDEESEKIKHYRVDKMQRAESVDLVRNGEEEFKKVLATYSSATFSMYGGDLKKVFIRFPKELCGVFIDRFGKDISIFPVGKDMAEVHVDVVVSGQFFGWIFGLGDSVEIVSPQNVVEQMRSYAEGVLARYQNK